MDSEANSACPTISVVVPVRNGEGVVGDCVASLLAQRYPRQRFEVIVVDNGSTDGTAAEVARLPVRLVKCAVPGPSPARNVGVREARGEIVAFTDCDCVADPSWLAELALAFDDEGVGAAGGPIEALVHPRRTLVEQFGEREPPLRNYRSGEGEFLPYLFGANAAYRRQLLLAIGGWPETLGTAEDVELTWRLQLRTGARVEYRPRAVVRHRHRSTWVGLARQFWTYGLGEVLLDSLFRGQPNYPRDGRFYRRRLSEQVAALPRYLVSGAIRALRRANGRADALDAALPWFRLTAESANLAAKVTGLILSRGLRDPEPLRRYLKDYVPAQHLRRRRRLESA